MEGKAHKEKGAEKKDENAKDVKDVESEKPKAKKSQKE